MRGFKELLEGKIPKTVLDEGRFGFDIIGDIAIIEVAKGHVRYQKAVAQAVRELYPHVKTVAKKVGGHGGKYRTQELQVIAGAKRLETEHREAGVRLLLDPSTVYFSPRLAEERLRKSAEAHQLV